MRSFVRRASIALVAVAVAALGLPALAGAAKSRLFVTGFDPDFHCTVVMKRAPQKRGTTNTACDFFAHAVPFVREGAPHPHKPVLVLDRETSNSPIGGDELVGSLKNEFGNDFPMVVMAPQSHRFHKARITTRKYSALLVASDTTCEGCDLNELDSTVDSHKIAARKRAIRRFFRHGGGILALSSGHDPSHCAPYYEFLPIHIPCPGVTGGGTSTVTPAGQRLGFTAANFGDAHNFYDEPGPNSRLRVAARQSGSPFDPTALFAKVRQH